MPDDRARRDTHFFDDSGGGGPNFQGRERAPQRARFAVARPRAEQVLARDAGQRGRNVQQQFQPGRGGDTIGRHFATTGRDFGALLDRFRELGLGIGQGGSSIGERGLLAAARAAQRFELGNPFGPQFALLAETRFVLGVRREDRAERV